MLVYPISPKKTQNLDVKVEQIFSIRIKGSYANKVFAMGNGTLSLIKSNKIPKSFKMKPSDGDVLVIKLDPYVTKNAPSDIPQLKEILYQGLDLKSVSKTIAEKLQKTPLKILQNLAKSANISGSTNDVLSLSKSLTSHWLAGKISISIRSGDFLGTHHSKGLILRLADLQSNDIENVIITIKYIKNWIPYLTDWNVPNKTLKRHPLFGMGQTFSNSHITISIDYNKYDFQNSSVVPSPITGKIRASLHSSKDDKEHYSTIVSTTEYLTFIDVKPLPDNTPYYIRLKFLSPLSDLPYHSDQLDVFISTHHGKKTIGKYLISGQTTHSSKLLIPTAHFQFKIFHTEDHILKPLNTNLYYHIKGDTSKNFKFNRSKINVQKPPYTTPKYEQIYHIQVISTPKTIPVFFYKTPKTSTYQTLTALQLKDSGLPRDLLTSGYNDSIILSHLDKLLKSTCTIDIYFTYAKLFYTLPDGNRRNTLSNVPYKVLKDNSITKELKHSKPIVTNTDGILSLDTVLQKHEKSLTKFDFVTLLVNTDGLQIPWAILIQNFHSAHQEYRNRKIITTVISSREKTEAYHKIEPIKEIHLIINYTKVKFEASISGQNIPVANQVIYVHSEKKINGTFKPIRHKQLLTNNLGEATIGIVKNSKMDGEYRHYVSLPSTIFTVGNQQVTIMNTYNSTKVKSSKTHRDKGYLSTSGPIIPAKPMLIHIKLTTYHIQLLLRNQDKSLLPLKSIDVELYIKQKNKSNSFVLKNVQTDNRGYAVFHCGDMTDTPNYLGYHMWFEAKLNGAIINGVKMGADWSSKNKFRKPNKQNVNEIIDGSDWGSATNPIQLTVGRDIKGKAMFENRAISLNAPLTPLPPGITMEIINKKNNGVVGVLESSLSYPYNLEGVCYNLKPGDNYFLRVKNEPKPNSNIKSPRIYNYKKQYHRLNYISPKDSKKSCPSIFIDSYGIASAPCKVTTDGSQITQTFIFKNDVWGQAFRLFSLKAIYETVVWMQYMSNGNYKPKHPSINGSIKNELTLVLTDQTGTLAAYHNNHRLIYLSQKMFWKRLPLIHEYGHHILKQVCEFDITPNSKYYIDAHKHGFNIETQPYICLMEGYAEYLGTLMDKNMKSGYIYIRPSINIVKKTGGQIKLNNAPKNFGYNVEGVFTKLLHKFTEEIFLASGIKTYERLDANIHPDPTQNPETLTTEGNSYLENQKITQIYYNHFFHLLEQLRNLTDNSGQSRPPNSKDFVQLLKKTPYWKKLKHFAKTMKME